MKNFVQEGGIYTLSQDQQNVNQFHATVAFYPLPIPQPVNIKHQKTGDFLMFSRGVEGASGMKSVKLEISL